MTASSRQLPLASPGCACCAPADTTVLHATGSSAGPASALTLAVEGLTCQGCASRVTKAIHAVDRNAQVDVTLVAHGRSTVTVTSSAPVDTAALQSALAAAGYSGTEA